MSRFIIPLVVVAFFAVGTGCKKKKNKEPAPQKPSTQEKAIPKGPAGVPVRYKNKVNDAVKDGNKLREERLKRQLGQ